MDFEIEIVVLCHRNNMRPLRNSEKRRDFCRARLSARGGSAFGGSLAFKLFKMIYNRFFCKPKGLLYNDESKIPWVSE